MYLLVVFWFVQCWHRGVQTLPSAFPTVASDLSVRVPPIPDDYIMMM